MSSSPEVDPKIIPEFFQNTMRGVDMIVLAEQAVIVYEQGTGGPVISVTGALIRPNETQIQEVGDMLWVLPTRDEKGRRVQSAEQAKLIQINRRYVIEIGSVVKKEELA